MAGTFVYDKTVETKLARGIDMALVLESYTEAAEAGVVRVAPVGKYPGGYYKNSIHSAVGIELGILIGRVWSTDRFAHLVEFGSMNNPPYAPLRRGVETTGLIVIDRGKP